ncbi:MAG: ketopantoate reductase family protein [Lachnospiraceae bacterium]|nr:ketopantoate reductase family protein [Lachnospiraceae bacterium]
MRTDNIAIVGMGALGLLFGGELAENHEGHTAFVMDPERAGRHRKDRYVINGREVSYTIETPEEFLENGKADVILVGVKFPTLNEALDLIAPLAHEDTVFVSMLNGISSERIIAERFGADNVIYTVSQGMDAQREGAEIVYSKHGELIIGVPHGADQKLRERLAGIDELFERCKVPHTLEPEILYRLWCKFMLNVGINQTCMVYDSDYAGVTRPGSEEYAMNVAAMREVAALGQAEGIPLGEKEINQYLDIIASLDPSATPSMGQDRRQKRPSEVDMFAGEVIALGRKHDIKTPANEFLYRRVKEIEATYNS